MNLINVINSLQIFSLPQKSNANIFLRHTFQETTELCPFAIFL